MLSKTIPIERSNPKPLGLLLFFFISLDIFGWGGVAPQACASGRRDPTRQKDYTPPASTASESASGGTRSAAPDTETQLPPLTPRTPPPQPQVRGRSRRKNRQKTRKTKPTAAGRLGGPAQRRDETTRPSG